MAIETMTIGGGCFWCLDSVYRLVDGVISSRCGYAAGDTDKPDYESICTGRTGHAEVVQLEYDTSKIDFETLLEILFTIHDPTTLNRQGNDVGTQYRSIILYHDAQQQQIAEALIRRLTEQAVYASPIVTEVEALETFYPAEDYHQDYFTHNPENHYCQYVIPPKLEKAAKYFRK